LASSWAKAVAMKAARARGVHSCQPAAWRFFLEHWHFRAVTGLAGLFKNRAFAQQAVLLICRVAQHLSA
jgi:hypothetical protein